MTERARENPRSPDCHDSFTRGVHILLLSYFLDLQVQVQVQVWGGTPYRPTFTSRRPNFFVWADAAGPPEHAHTTPALRIAHFAIASYTLSPHILLTVPLARTCRRITSAKSAKWLRNDVK